MRLHCLKDTEVSFSRMDLRCSGVNIRERTCKHKDFCIEGQPSLADRTYIGPKRGQRFVCLHVDLDFTPFFRGGRGTFLWGV